MPQLELQELTAAKLERATKLQSEESRQRNDSALAPGFWLLDLASPQQLDIVLDLQPRGTEHWNVLQGFQASILTAAVKV